MTDLTVNDLDPTGDIRTIAEDAGALDPTGTRREMLRRAGIGGAVLAGAGPLFAGMLSPLEAFAASSSTGAYSHVKSAANDVKIGNFALTLEYLEAAFYKQAHEGSGLSDPEISGFAKVLAGHEASHVLALKKILGRKAVSSPTVAFGNAVTDQTTFLVTATKLEPVGTAAYQGAGPYISSVAIVKAALSILPVEASHAAWALTLAKDKGILPSADPAPFAFYEPGSYTQTLSKVKATGFVTGNLHP